MHPDGAAAATLVTETLGAVFGADVVRKQLLGATVRRGPPARPRRLSARRVFHSESGFA